MSQLDWRRATVKVTVPVVHTATETVEEIDVSLSIFTKIARDTFSRIVVTDEQATERIAEILDRRKPGWRSGGAT